MKFNNIIVQFLGFGSVAGLVFSNVEASPRPSGLRLMVENGTVTTSNASAKQRLYLTGSSRANQEGTKISIQNITNLQTIVVEPQSDVEGSEFQFDVEVGNHLNTSTMLHWHGLMPPSNEDGVPYISATAIKPGSSVAYRFEEKQRGLYWVHSHWAWQNAEGASAPILIKSSPETDAKLGLKGARDVMFMVQDQHDRQVCEFDALIYPEWCSPDPANNGRVPRGSVSVYTQKGGKSGPQSHL